MVNSSLKVLKFVRDRVGFQHCIWTWTWGPLPHILCMLLPREVGPAPLAFNQRGALPAQSAFTYLGGRNEIQNTQEPSS